MKGRRSDKEEELQKEGWGSSMTEEQIDKLKYAENKMGNQGFEKPTFIKQAALEKIK